MIISQPDSNVVSSHNLGPTHEFQIRTSAHAFKMLSSGLYSDKIGAVLREIGCNAHDAHISNGKSHVPFEVKLPNSIDNQFWIKDEGPGLSHDDVMGLYTTYFASTKQSSNDFTGAFGLGSKSPFSYTDSFTVTSCFGGKKRIYSAHIGAAGSPNIAQMSEQDCGSETGITVGFPVKPSDFEQFRQKAAQIYRYFTPYPKIIGGDPIKPLQYVYNEADWGFLQEYSTHYPTVQMGNVAYNFNPQKITMTDKLAIAAGSTGGTIIRFPLGALEVAASREELQYDLKTTTALSTAFRKIAISIIKTVEKEWLAVSDWKSKCGFHKKKEALRRGISFDTTYLQEAGVKNAKDLYLAIYNHHAKIRGINTHKVHAIHYQMGNRGIKANQLTFDTFVNYDEDMQIVIGEEANATRRIRKAINEASIKTAILIYPFKKNKGTMTDVNTAVRQILDDTGNIKITDLVDFEEPAKIKRAKKGQFSALPPEYENSSKIYLPFQKRRHGQIIYLLDKDKGLQVANWRAEAFDNARTTLQKELGLQEPVTLTLSDINSYKLKKRPDWSPYIDYVKGALEDKNTLAILESKLKTYRRGIDLAYDHIGVLVSLVRLKNALPTNYSTITAILKKKDILDIVEETYKASKAGYKNTKPEILENYTAMLGWIGSTIKAPELQLVEEEIETKFPNAAKLEFNVLYAIATMTPKTLPTFIEEILK